MSADDAGGEPRRPLGAERTPRPRVGAIVRRNLVALGTAAVLTVYVAGYARTRAAAQRFAEADRAGRRLVPPVAPSGDSAASHMNETAPVANAGATSPSVSSTGTDRAIARHAPVATPPSPPASSPPPRPATVPTTDSVVPEVQRDSATELATAALADSTSVPPVSDSSARPLLKDGEYYGWGTSRHGDIQAGVEIKGGRITAAWVQQCLTRYSCSWIAALPGQVVTRQSPEVDYISGATQSTNAFYYAVVEALARAK